MSKTRRYIPEGPELNGQHHRLRKRDARRITALKSILLKPSVVKETVVHPPETVRYLPENWILRLGDDPNLPEEHARDTRLDLLHQLGEQMLQEDLLI